MEKQISHNFMLENKVRAYITGVQEVLSATDKCVIIKLVDSLMTLQGDGLKIEKLSPEEKSLTVKGTVLLARYGGEQKSFFKRLFK